ncbi:carbonic anhydrase [Falsihalocynthiibacter arcticus]|uniref:carbonic anhydrase n=1 Tax=Falsihalocynthiibacter arcticus TaxID=1579316 RepID=A0A126UYF5_9RHOB|nr:carbonic anhydrase [Falsihalocynthiibacter arcticus]AML50469.1 carbonic anhydrase [Falsihalocynthiibacter arcticus]
MCQDCPDKTVNRRNLIVGGLALAGAGATISPAAAQTATDEAMPVSPEEALQRLIDGNARYVANAPINTDHSVGRVARAAGQQPFAAVVCCSDSRVAPELVFDQGPGALFVVRVAGNFINEDGLASLEFGAAVLGLKLIVVLGHSSCGAVVATIASIQDNELPPGHLPSLVNAIRPAVYDVMAKNPDDLLVAATERNAINNAERAQTEAPILSELHSSGKLKSAAAIYEISTGEVTFLS